MKENYYSGEKALKGNFKDKHYCIIEKIEERVIDRTFTKEVADDLYENLYRYQLENKSPEDYLGNEKDFINSVVETYFKDMGNSNILRVNLGHGLLIAAFSIFGLIFTYSKSSMATLIGALVLGLIFGLANFVLSKLIKSQYLTTISLVATGYLSVYAIPHIYRFLGIEDRLKGMEIPFVIMLIILIGCTTLGAYLKYYKSEK